MPGVYVETNVRSGPSAEGEVKEAQVFIAGKTERGPVSGPTLVRGVAEFEALYGGYESGNLYADVRTYFEEGGQRAHVYRVLGAGASTSDLTLNDTQSDPTLLITAANPGEWGDTVEIAVTAGDAADTFKISLYLNTILQFTTRDLTSPADAVAVINSSAVNHLIVATDLGSANIAPANNAATVAATALSGGADEEPVEADFVDALDQFSADLGVGAVALPGQSGTNVWNALITHAAENNRIALCAFADDATQDAAKTAVAAYYSNQYAEYAAFYFPWVTVPDPASAGLTISVSPETFAAAGRAKAVTQTGPWRAGAGLISESNFVNGLVETVAKADADILDEKRINVIRKVGNSFRVYGARSIDSDEDNWRYITFRDTINFIVSQAEERLEDFVFQTIDARGSLFSRIEAALVGMLDPIRIQGGLFEAFDSEGGLIDPGYTVEVSDLINPVSALAQGKIAAKVGVRVSTIGDTIMVTVTKSNLTTSVL